jgi:hypothetical protein
MDQDPFQTHVSAKSVVPFAPPNKTVPALVVAIAAPTRPDGPLVPCAVQLVPFQVHVSFT